MTNLNTENINIEQIKDLLLDESVSIYSIAKDIGVSRSTLNLYRTGQSKLENMRIKLAKKLQQYINDKTDNNCSYRIKKEIIKMKTYKITTSDIKDFLEEGKDFSVELYKDGTCSVLPADAYGYPGDRMARIEFEYYDFEDCDKDFDAYKDWIESNFYSCANENGYTIEII